jgi:hypothetical protein
MSMIQKSYPSGVSDAEWEFLLPYLSLMREHAPQREYPLVGSDALDDWHETTSEAFQAIDHDRCLQPEGNRDAEFVLAGR